jgi:hypothetical protein
MVQVLLIDNNKPHVEAVRARLRRHRVEVEVCADPAAVTGRLRRTGSRYEVVILNVSDHRQPWLRLLSKFREASLQAGNYPAPLFLCVSTGEQPVDFELRIERMGARYVCER